MPLGISLLMHVGNRFDGAESKSADVTTVGKNLLCLYLVPFPLVG